MGGFVIDTNCMKDPDLAKILTTGEPVVLTVQVLAEALNAGTPHQAREELRILSTAPEQVLVAKPLGEVLYSEIVSQRQLIHDGATRGLRRLLQNIGDTPDEVWMAMAARSRHQVADELKKFALERHDIRPLLAQMKASWSKADLRVLQKGGQLSNAATTRKIDTAFKIARTFLLQKNDPLAKATKARLIDVFAFRFAVCQVSRLVQRMSEGLNTQLKPHVARNDLIDTVVCAYSTYFKYFLCLDDRPRQTHWDATQMLKSAMISLRDVSQEHKEQYAPGEVPF